MPEDLVATCDRVPVHRSGAGLLEVDAGTADELVARVYAVDTLAGRLG